jgi:hypothetical protein
MAKAALRDSLLTYVNKFRAACAQDGRAFIVRSNGPAAILSPGIEAFFLCDR